MKRTAVTLFVFLLIFLSFGCSPLNENGIIPSPGTSSSADTSPSPLPSSTPSADTSAVVATVNGSDITLGDVLKQTKGSEMMYLNLEGQLTEAEIYEKTYRTRCDALDMLIHDRLIAQKVAEYGIALTADEQETAKARLESQLDSIRSYVRNSYPDISDGELESTVDSLLSGQGSSIEQIKEGINNALLFEKLKKALVYEAAPVIEPAAIQARNDSLLAEQTAAYNACVDNYEAALLAGDIIVYRPQECKRVNMMYLRFDDEITALIDQLKQYDSEKEAEEMRQKELIRIKDVVKKAEDALSSGTAFEEVVSAIGANGDYSENYICDGSTRFSEEIKEAAILLKEAGDISRAVEAPLGVYILKLEEVIPAGTDSFESTKDAIEEALRLEMSESIFEEQQDKWHKEATIDIHREKLK